MTVEPTLERDSAIFILANMVQPDVLAGDLRAVIERIEKAARAAALREVAEKVAALHHRGSTASCANCGERWPCRTVAILTEATDTSQPWVPDSNHHAIHDNYADLTESEGLL